ncbi:PAS domain-containing sensor histidine kinase [Anoxybacterium hadale]|uniref:PAS domain-containing sensor histidine kinase n=1 Tax=Anoxybacterium hadale TaxID=3408580 RepID=A0ACD1ADL7_9FIRM|nr:PAS domain-containing sensor histidine kinase [Clostridiales bacterium]
MNDFIATSKENEKMPNQINKIIRDKTQVNQYMRKYFKELSVVKCISDGLVVIDKFHRLYFLNESGKEFYFKPDSIKFYEDVFYGTSYYDMEGSQLNLETLPGARALSGETIANESIKIVRPDKTLYCSINGNPVYDENNVLIFAVLCIRDTTENMLNYMKIEQQRERLLKVEQEKNEALESSMKLKDDFLYLITHEFRTPISVINSALQAIELLCSKEITTNISKYLKTIRQNTFRQLRLVDNLLDNIRYGSGNFKFHFTRFDIVYATLEIIRSVEPYSKQKEIQLDFNSELIEKFVIMDEEKYERILLNLLSNALKFTPSGKRVTIMLTADTVTDSKMLCVSVKDEGIGIPKEMQQKIFERFGQVDGVLSRKNEGTGIGLHLVKQIVHSLSGDIKLESQEGEGSTFSIYLPIGLRESIKETSVLKEDENENCRIERAVSIEFSDIYYN